MQAMIIFGDSQGGHFSPGLRNVMRKYGVDVRHATNRACAFGVAPCFEDPPCAALNSAVMNMTMQFTPRDIIVFAYEAFKFCEGCYFSRCQRSCHPVVKHIAYLDIIAREAKRRKATLLVLGRFTQYATEMQKRWATMPVGTAVEPCVLQGGPEMHGRVPSVQRCKTVSHALSACPEHTQVCVRWS